MTTVRYIKMPAHHAAHHAAHHTPPRPPRLDELPPDVHRLIAGKLSLRDAARLGATAGGLHPAREAAREGVRARANAVRKARAAAEDVYARKITAAIRRAIKLYVIHDASAADWMEFDLGLKGIDAVAQARFEPAERNSTVGVLLFGTHPDDDLEVLVFSTMKIGRDRKIVLTAIKSEGVDKYVRLIMRAFKDYNAKPEVVTRAQLDRFLARFLARFD